MYGLSAVAVAVLRSSSSRARASSATMPSMRAEPQRLHRIAKNRRRVQRIPRDDRHHHVQLELTGFAGERDRRDRSP